MTTNELAALTVLVAMAISVAIGAHLGGNRGRVYAGAYLGLFGPLGWAAALFLPPPTNKYITPRSSL